MYIHFSTQLTDLYHARLISLAFVADTGEELYIEVTDYPRELSNAFVREAVEPLLGRTPGTVQVTQADVSDAVLKFLATHTSAVLACSQNIDWWVLQEVLGSSWDVEVRAENVHGKLDWMSKQAYLAAHARHHALTMAKANKHAFKA